MPNIFELLLAPQAKQQLKQIPGAIAQSAGQLGNQATVILKNLLGSFAGPALTGAQPSKEVNVLNPLQENVLKAVKKVHTKQVEEAMAQGAQGEQVLADAGISFGQKQPKPETTETGEQSTDPLSVALTGVQPPELQERPIPQRESWLGFKEHPAAYQKRLVNEGLIRNMLGMEPLQAGERELTKLKADLDMSNQKPLTPESAQKFSLLLEGRDATIGIDQLLGDNVTSAMWAQGVPTFLKSQQARLLESSIERSVQAKTRIETGAALAPHELKNTVKRYMPRKGDSIQTALKRLQPLYKFFDNAINIADPTGVHTQRALGGQTMPGTQGVTGKTASGTPFEVME